MSGRGKGERTFRPPSNFDCCGCTVSRLAVLTRLGGKGLGKGGAKRHRKVLRDNIQ
jgi:hypothetical protein